MPTSPSLWQQRQTQRALTKAHRSAEQLEKKNIPAQLNALNSVIDTLLDEVKQAPKNQKSPELKQAVKSINCLLTGLIKRSK